MEQQTLCLRFFGKGNLQTFILGGQWCILSLGQSICDAIRQDYLHTSMLIKDFKKANFSLNFIPTWNIIFFTFKMKSSTQLSHNVCAVSFYGTHVPIL